MQILTSITLALDLSTTTLLILSKNIVQTMPFAIHHIRNPFPRKIKALELTKQLINSQLFSQLFSQL
jgi:hypothetical protein